MKDLCGEKNKVETLMIDIASAINLVKNLIRYGCIKHIEMRFHYLRELVSEGKLKLECYKNEDQVVSFLTKWVSIEVFKKHMSMKDFEYLN